MSFLIDRPRSIIPALDCGIERAVEIVKALADVEQVSGFKLGSWKGVLLPGLSLYTTALTPHLRSRHVLIYDHQKGATDIPDLEDAMEQLAGLVEAVILFPFGGRETQRRWTAALIRAGVVPIIGGHMTQKEFLASDGGYISDDAPERIYRLAVEQGVRHFVVPGNKPELVAKYRAVIEDELARQGCKGEKIDLYAPGFVTQGGEISEAGKAAGEYWHAIVGRAIVEAENIEVTARELASQIG